MNESELTEQVAQLIHDYRGLAHRLDQIEAALLEIRKNALPPTDPNAPAPPVNHPA